MLVRDMVYGQIVKINEGKHAGHAGQIRQVNPDKNTVTLMVMGKLKTVPAACVEPESE